MKNNRLTNAEIIIIKEAVRNIHELSSMKNCGFKNQETVEINDLKLWLQWFDCYASKIEKIVGREDDLY